MILPVQDRPDRRVDVPLGGEVVTVHPDGRVVLPAVFAGAHPRQIADLLRSEGVLPPAPVEDLDLGEEEHAYPCDVCGGNGWPCRTCGGTGERIDRGHR